MPRWLSSASFLSRKRAAVIAGLVALLAFAYFLPPWAASQPDKEPAVKLPAAFAWIPGEARYVQVSHAANLWNSPLAVAIRARTELNEFRVFGLDGDVERTFADRFGLEAAKVTTVVVVRGEPVALLPMLVMGGLQEILSPQMAYRLEGRVRGDRKKEQRSKDFDKDFKDKDRFPEKDKGGIRDKDIKDKSNIEENGMPCSNEQPAARDWSARDLYLRRVTANKVEDVATLKAKAEGWKASGYKGQTLYEDPVWEDRHFIFVDQRTYMLGSKNDLEYWLDNQGKSAPPASLAKALAQDGRGPSVITWFDVRKQAAGLRGDALVPEHLGRVFRGLAPAQHGSVTLDLNKKFQVDGTLHFPNDKQAARAVGNLQDILHVLRLEMLFQRMERRQELNDGDEAETVKRMFLVRLFEEINEYMRSAKVVHRKEALDWSFSLPLNLTALEKQAAADAKELLGDEKAQLAARKRHSINNFSQIALALHSHHDIYKAFPPPAIVDKGGKPLLSWRVAILQLLEQEDLYKQFRLDLPWDHPHNLKLVEKMPKVFAAPGIKTKEPGLTHYRGFVATANVPAQLTMWSGQGGPSKGTRIAHVTDGLSNTLMLVEAAEPVVWTKPEELPFDPAKPLPKLGGLYGDGFHVLFGDRSVRFISSRIDPVILRALITRAGGEVTPDDFDR